MAAAASVPFGSGGREPVGPPLIAHTPLVAVAFLCTSFALSTDGFLGVFGGRGARVPRTPGTEAGVFFSP